MSRWIPLLMVACSGGDDDEETGPLEDLATEPCNQIDDDKDGLIDEGNDVDGDGVPDCFDEEECDGLDNDGDGEVDEGFDSDGDGIGDCLDEEVCNEVDDDGDGEVDEGFPLGCDPCNGKDDDDDGEIDEDAPDTDEDGIPDCLDSEECDGLDNDGDYQIDEDTDHDFDGICDEDDVEVCDGWDNDGDGLRDEGFDDDGDGQPDCWIPEACDGVDNDGDGQLDEDFADSDGDGVPDCMAFCGVPIDFTVCVEGSGFPCSYAQPATVVSQQSGYVLDLAMSGWSQLWLTALIDAPAGEFLLNLADSPTCDGYGGDAGTTAYDAELQISGGTDFQIYGAFPDGGLQLSVPNAFDPVADGVFVQVCQGWVGYRSASGTFAEWSGSTSFQWDGTEPDYERAGGLNDRDLHLGVGRTVFDPTRNGTGVEDVVVVLGR